MKVSIESHKQERDVLTTQIKELQQELQSVKKSLEEQMKGKVKKYQEDLRFYSKEKRQLKKELEALKVASYKHQKQLETRIKVHEEEKKVLITMNQELRQELEGIKTRVPRNNLQLASSGSGPQGQIETSGRTVQPKVSMDSFHPIRILGEGGFGKVLLVKKKGSDESDQRFAVKVLKKSHFQTSTAHRCSFLQIRKFKPLHWPACAVSIDSAASLSGLSFKSSRISENILCQLIQVP